MSSFIRLNIQIYLKRPFPQFFNAVFLHCSSSFLSTVDFFENQKKFHFIFTCLFLAVLPIYDSQLFTVWKHTLEIMLYSY